jgi:hypothetical protein
MVSAARGVCGVCANPATVTDWMPLHAWIAVEGCPCGGFFIRRMLWAGRLPGMARTECQELAARIREWRAVGYEVWISTTDGTLHAPLFVSSVRPSPALTDQPRSQAAEVALYRGGAAGTACPAGRPPATVECPAAPRAGRSSWLSWVSICPAGPV